MDLDEVDRHILNSAFGLEKNGKIEKLLFI